MKRHIMYLIFLIGFIVSACGATVGDSPSGNPSTTPSSSYSPVSPHYPHMRTMTTDYWIHWEDDPDLRKAYWDWSAKHFDYILVDKYFRDNVAEYKKRNPNIKIFHYALNWTIGTSCSHDIYPGDDLFTGYCEDMKTWYQNYPQYNLEDSFLHDYSKCPPTAQKEESCRISFIIWGSSRWIINPGDPGLREYQKDRFKRMSEISYNGYPVDGIFLDEHGSGDMYGWDHDRLEAFQVREYYENGQTNWQKFEADMVGLLEIERKAANKPLLLNTGPLTTDFDFNMIKIASGTHTELMNNPTIPLDLDKVWDWYDKLLSNDIFVQIYGSEVQNIPAGYTKGLYSSPYARFNIVMFTSYYMVYPDRSKIEKAVFHWGAPIDNWNKVPVPMDKWWLKAFNVDLGNPSGTKYKLTEGTDPLGNPYRIWARNFEKALVLIRPVGTWGYNIYDDSTAIEVTLPQDDSYYLLNDDGTLSGPLKSIKLRNSEGAILLKGSKLQ